MLDAPEAATLDKHTVVILLYEGVDADTRQGCYAYIALRLNRLMEFQRAIEKEAPFPLEEYGQVLRSGHGVPDEETRAYMEREYGFRHDAMVKSDN